MYRVGFFMSVLVVAMLGISCSGSRIANPGYMHLAAQAGDYAGIDAALKSGGDVNQADGYGMTPLLYAAAVPNITVVEYLLNNGANPNHVADDGNTPLLVASRKGNLPVVESLILKGARIDSFGEDGFTSLTIASERGNKNLFDLLMKSGANPNAIVANSDTALIKSIIRTDAYFFDRLIAAGADPNLPGRAGNTPLIIATYANNLEIVDKLLSAGSRVNDVNDAGYSALHFVASIKGINPEIVELLVEKGADVNQSAPDGLTPLKVACITGHADMAAYLYEKGANPKFEDSSAGGMEINGTINHILGDYFLAQDNFDKARAYYVKAQDYYNNVAGKHNGDATKLVWKQAGATAGAIVLIAAALPLIALNPAAAGLVAGQMAAQHGFDYSYKNPSGVNSVQQTHIGIQSYDEYMSKYNQAYMPTYQVVNMAIRQPPPSESPFPEQIDPSKMARHFEKCSVLIGNVLECFDKNPSGGVALHACVNTVTRTFSADTTQ